MRTRKRPPTHPGEILQLHYLEPLNLTVDDVALATGLSKRHITQLLSKKRGVTPDLALRFAKALDTTPQLWLNLQSAYDLWQASQASDEWQQVRAIFNKNVAVPV